MCKTFSSFEQLGHVLRDIPKVEISIFDVLSDKHSSETAKKKAMKDLSIKVDHILSRLEAKDFLFGVNESKSDYNDYCRNLAAFTLAAHKDNNITRVMLSLEMLLENMAPDNKTELRKLKKTLKEDCACIESYGYSWADLKLPFFANVFAQRFTATTISVTAKPQAFVVEKEEIKEVVEKNVEKPIIIEKEVAPKEDLDYFGVEDHHTEFKSSFLEPPHNANYTNQKLEICRKICAFLNADGGKVYIGVNPTTGKGYPAREGSIYYGVARDIFWHLTTTTYCHAPINNQETYRRYMKREIQRIFEASNENVSLFINDCIHIEPTKNENVVVINVMPSRYCVVYLNGIAYQRDGEECKEMDDAQILIRKQNLRIISKEVRFEDDIAKAIKGKKQVILYGYYSVNSNSIDDRHVEPYEFVCNGESILCYDLDKKSIRQFKLSRVSGVRVLKDEWKHEDQHIKANTDVFDWTDTGDRYHICLDMKLRAMTFFCEFFANANKNLFEHVGNGIYRLDTIVYSLTAVKSFFLSMANEITIQDTEDSEELRNEIRNFVLEYVK